MRERPACVPSAGPVTGVRRGERVFRKGSSSGSTPRRAWGRPRVAEGRGRGPASLCPPGSVTPRGPSTVFSLFS